MKKKKPSKKVTFSIVLDEEDHDRLIALAEKESRPKAQMARVILERVLRQTK